MAYSAKILADSISKEGGVRLTTIEATYPRFVHSEVMTHRVFSRNSASSRAIPIEKMLTRVMEDPVIPVWWGKNQKGMQASEEIAGDDLERARVSWLEARDVAVEQARRMQEFGVHKQLVNRLVEPWMWITVIITATEWGNFFGLRCHPDAQPEIRRIAEMMREAMAGSNPTPVGIGGWHLPLTDDQDFDAIYAMDDLCRVSVGRCARVSYLTHDGKRDWKADIELANRLQESGHMSPFEHVAAPNPNSDEFVGNLRGWVSYRRRIPYEYDFSQRQP